MAESAAKTGKSFARNRFKFAGVVTALSDPLGSGGRSLPGSLLNPARPMLLE
jgi:hypothetical protein